MQNIYSLAISTFTRFPNPQQPILAVGAQQVLGEGEGQIGWQEGEQQKIDRDRLRPGGGAG